MFPHFSIILTILIPLILIPVDSQSEYEYDSDYDPLNTYYDYDDKTSNSTNVLVNQSSLAISTNQTTIKVSDTNQNKVNAKNDCECDYESYGCSVDYFTEKFTANDGTEEEKKNDHKSEHNISDAIVSIDRLMSAMTTTRKNVNPFATRVLQRITETLYTIDLPQQCSESLLRIYSALKSNELWAYKFIDAFGAIPSGLSEGVLSSFGEYDQCLNIESVSRPDRNDTIFYGQYCLAKSVFRVRNTGIRENSVNNINISSEFLKKLITDKNSEQNLDLLLSLLNFTNGTVYQSAICIPSTCSPKDIEIAINNLIQPMIRHPILIGPQCHTKYAEKQLNGHQLMAIFIFALFITFVIIGTMCDIFTDSDSDPKKVSCVKCIFTNFSVAQNTRKLLLHSIDHNLIIVDVILVAALCWYLHQNSYLISATFGLFGLKRIVNGIPTRMFEDSEYFWVRFRFPINLYIMCCGLILGYRLLLITTDPKYRNRKFNIFNYLAHHYMKFCSLLIGPILLIYILPLVADGPLWDNIDPMLVQQCKSGLKQSFIFYNNFLSDILKVCNTPSIFISVLFQLNIIAPLFTLLLNYEPYGTVITLITIVVSRVVVTLTAMSSNPGLINELTIKRMKSDLMDESSLITNTSDFLIGLFTAFLIIKKQYIYISAKLTVLLWIVCPLISVSAILWNEQFDGLETKSPLFLLFSPILWLIGFVWLFYYICTYRLGDLSAYRFLIPFRIVSRLSYHVILVTLIGKLYEVYTIKDTYEMTDSLMLISSMISFVTSVLLAYIFYILFECPLLNLSKHLTNF